MGRIQAAREALDRMVIQLSPRVSGSIRDFVVVNCLARVALAGGLGDANEAHRLLLIASNAIRGVANTTAD